MTTKENKQQQLKRHILRKLYFDGPLSLADLCTQTGKSLPIVTASISNLTRDNYVIEHGLAPSTGGRRAATYSLNAQKQLYILAVAIDQLETRFQVYDLVNQRIGKLETLRFSLLEHPKDALQHLTVFIKDCINKTGIPLKKILGLGLGMPGIINVIEKINHTFFQVSEQSLPGYLSATLGIPVFIDNDSRAIALAEQKFGLAKGITNSMVINIGWGIGLGMIVNDIIFSGTDGYAGEFSHIPLSATKNLCTCGKRGCLEVDASLITLVTRAQQAIQDGAKSSLEVLLKDLSKLPGEQLLLAAYKGDQLATKLIGESGFAIGKGIATLIHILNPELIVLSGRGSVVGRIFLAPIHQAINEFCIPRLAERTKILVSKIGKDAELLGAAALVIQDAQF